MGGWSHILLCLCTKFFHMNLFQLEICMSVRYKRADITNECSARTYNAG